MAKRVVHVLVDDLDGTEISAEEGQTVRFGLDGAELEIDLTNEHANEMRAALAPYLAVAAKVGRLSAAGGPHRVTLSSGNSGNREEARDARAWYGALPDAARKALNLPATVGGMGRVPVAVIGAYRARNSVETAAAMAKAKEAAEVIKPTPGIDKPTSPLALNPVRKTAAAAKKAAPTPTVAAQPKKATRTRKSTAG